MQHRRQKSYYYCKQCVFVVFHLPVLYVVLVVAPLVLTARLPVISLREILATRPTAVCW